MHCNHWWNPKQNSNGMFFAVRLDNYSAVPQCRIYSKRDNFFLSGLSQIILYLFDFIYAV